MIFIIGSQGRLGNALASSYPNENVTRLNRHIYQDWWQQDSQNKITDFFAPFAEEDSVIFVTSGILDPKTPHEEHLRVNYLLPKHIIEGATKVGLRVVTFGTVMENLIHNKNSYIETKTILGNYVADFSINEKLALHIRIHTLYGSGQPSPFMFLGQIYHSLIEQSIFNMSPGKQLREYHHIDDEVNAIRMLVATKISGVIDLSHGYPRSLKDIASYIFKSFDSDTLLHIGALPEPKEENYETVFQRPKLLSELKFRDELPAIVNYLKVCKQESEEHV